MRIWLVAGAVAGGLFACLLCIGVGLVAYHFGTRQEPARRGIFSDAEIQRAAERVKLQNDAKEAAIKAFDAAKAANDPVAMKVARDAMDAASSPNWQPKKK